MPLLKVSMKMRDFIEAHREAIDQRIIRVCPNVGQIDDDERRVWILNDEPLYLWARQEGVRI